jgi:DNA-directed RNA polymerase specialized sigma24 family protein
MSFGDASARLAEHARLAAQLRRAGLSDEQIAQTLGLSVQQVRALLERRT